jgi:hypothetical protein
MFQNRVGNIKAALAVHEIVGAAIAESAITANELSLPKLAGVFRKVSADGSDAENDQQDKADLPQDAQDPYIKEITQQRSPE